MFEVTGVALYVMILKAITAFICIPCSLLFGVACIP